MKIASPLLFIALLTTLSIPARGDNNQAPANPLAKRMEGKWVLSGTPDDIKPAPKAGGRIKTITGNRWEIVEKDPKTGKVLFRHGGTFTVDGNTHTESIEFANENTKFLVGKKMKFKISIENGILLNHGQGNPWNEAWRRVKKQP